MSGTSASYMVSCKTLSGKVASIFDYITVQWVFQEIDENMNVYPIQKIGSAYFPSLITSLCLRAHVKTQANLKGQYVQGCITNHDLERLAEKVHELNQGEQEEPTEPDTEESTNETEIEANSVIDTKKGNLIRNRTILNQLKDLQTLNQRLSQKKKQSS
ncbi:hypothetical protein J1N35_025560 [Gossypium stocksii]|uniref:Uncharacterized protein n=1 Tax=Gossypium stocksii TaxID=47602 RepID=A0A9D3ZX98_9ROSI|nr:hypothetical protein J1N35_025560 [Gossypium stocksii]